jgi:hypothetical protein
MENRLCAVKNNNEWLRGRCQLVSTDKQIVKVRYIDWGNIVHIKAKGKLNFDRVKSIIYLFRYSIITKRVGINHRNFSSEKIFSFRFYQESACCLPCRLDGVDDIKFDTKILDYYNEILIGIINDN